jgi:hypothetical protein
MTEIPQTRYAKAPDGTSIAYQVVGEGPVDLVSARIYRAPGRDPIELS